MSARDDGVAGLVAAVAGGRPAWRNQAACRGLDPALFFPERGASTAGARAVCRVCPVREVCATEAVTRNEQFGIWGDTSIRQRRALRRELVAAVEGVAA